MQAMTQLANSLIVPLPGGADELTVGELREYALLWHGGQWSPLYAFGSSGTVTPGLANEARECARMAAAQGDRQARGLDDLALEAIAGLEASYL